MPHNQNVRMNLKLQLDLMTVYCKANSSLPFLLLLKINMLNEYPKCFIVHWCNCFIITNSFNFIPKLFCFSGRQSRMVQCLQRLLWSWYPKCFLLLGWCQTVQPATGGQETLLGSCVVSGDSSDEGRGCSNLILLS